MPRIPRPSQNGSGLQTRALSTVQPERIQWLWPGRIALGKLNVLQGDPGAGKSWTALYILSRITTGRAFCDGPSFRKGQALYVTAEDGIADTVRPRMDMLGGGTKDTFILDNVQNGEDPVEAFSLDKHAQELDTWLTKHSKVRVMVLDPLASFVGRIDTRHNAEVRNVLGPLATLAEKHQIAVIGINHLTKSQTRAIYRGLDSIAFTAIARSVWQVSLDPDDEDRRLFLPVKMNLAKANGLAFRITDQGLEWEDEPISLSADDAQAPQDGNESLTRRDEAKAWLKDLLKHGPFPSEDVPRKAQKDGICFKTLRFAKKELGVVSRKNGLTGIWCWTWPIKTG